MDVFINDCNLSCKINYNKLYLVKYSPIKTLSAILSVTMNHYVFYKHHNI